jgi:hypothetical protein
MARGFRNICDEGPNRPPKVGVAIAVVAVLAILFSPRGGPPAAAGATDVTGSVDPALVDDLKRQGVVIGHTFSDPAALSEQEVIVAARSSAPFVGDSPAVAASLVRFSDDVYGSEDETGGIQPFFSDTEAWVVVFTPVKTPIMGGPGMPNGSYDSSTVVFVDPYGAKLLEALAI